MKKITDIIDVKTFQRIQDLFSTATGLAAISVDAEGNYITEGSNFTDFCMKYTRNSMEGKRRCEKCDRECKGVYHCHAGLIDFASDIFVDGEKICSVIGGQVLPEEPDFDRFREVAKEMNIPEEEYIEALKKVPIRSEKSIKAAAALLEEVFTVIINQHYMGDKLLETMSGETTEAVAALEEINEKTKELQSIANKQNILTLNASIEATRAGEAGVGFAVVAKQMGALSKDSSEIYKGIKGCTDKINKSITVISNSLK